MRKRERKNFYLKRFAPEGIFQYHLGQCLRDSSRNLLVMTSTQGTKKPQNVVYTCYGGRPKAGAYEFFILLWKTHRHGSVTMGEIIAKGKKKSRKKNFLERKNVLNNTRFRYWK